MLAVYVYPVYIYTEMTQTYTSASCITTTNRPRYVLLMFYMVGMVFIQSWPDSLTRCMLNNDVATHFLAFYFFLSLSISVSLFLLFISRYLEIFVYIQWCLGYSQCLAFSWPLFWVYSEFEQRRFQERDYFGVLWLVATELKRSSN